MSSTLSRTSGDPAEGKHQCALLQYTCSGHRYLHAFALSLQYCIALIKRAMYYSVQVTGVGTLALFQTFGHAVLNIIRVSIGDFVKFVERCSIMRCLAVTAQYLLNCTLRRIMDYNCQLYMWRKGIIHVRVKGILYQKECKLQGGQSIYFVFISVN